MVGLGIIGYMLKRMEAFIMACTDTSHPDAVGFAFKSMLETTADPLFEKYLSVNSSQRLEYHYSSVRDSLTPVQKTGFDQSLRDTLGGSGTVAYGSVGVMALALAMLFDVLAAKMKGQKPLPDPIQQIFHGEGEALSKMRTAISDCLDHLPKGASEKEKMLLGMERCGKNVEGTLSNYTAYVLNQAQTTGHNFSVTERNHVLNAYLFYTHTLIPSWKDSPQEFEMFMEVIEENTKKWQLLYVFAPNVTYAAQNWYQTQFVNMTYAMENPDLKICFPQFVMFTIAGLRESQALNLAPPHWSFGLFSVSEIMTKLGDLKMDFVILN